MKTYTLEQLKEKKVSLSEYNQKEIDTTIELAKKISEFSPAEPIFYLSEEDGKFFFEHTAGAKLEHASLSIFVRHNQYSKKYHVICDSIDRLPNVDMHTKNDVLKSITAPVTIGVLSTKKINDWVRYYEQVYAKLTEKSAQHGSKIDEFLKSIEGMDVHWWDNKKQGEIIRNGIRFRFKIGTESVSKEIDIHYNVPATLDSFLHLSDNKFKAPKE